MRKASAAFWPQSEAEDQHSRAERTTFLLGVAAIKAQRSHYPNMTDIRQAEVSVFSQQGEDGILDYIFERLELAKPSFLEIGAGDFTECNSKFANSLRSSGVYLVDFGASPGQIYNREVARRVSSRLFFEQTFIDASNAEDVFKRAKSHLGKLDVLSIDIDGNDYWILKQIPLNEFEVVVVEYNPSLSDSGPVTVVYDPNFDRRKKHFSWKYYGANLEAFSYLLEKEGFCFIGATSSGTNAFFVKQKNAGVFSKVIKDAKSYINLDSREARDKRGVLSFADLQSERESLKDLPFVDVRTETTWNPE